MVGSVGTRGSPVSARRGPNSWAWRCAGAPHLLDIRSRVASTSAGELPPNSVGEAFDGQRTHQPMLDAGRAAQISLHPAVQRQLLGIRQRIKGQPQSDTDEFVSRRS